MHAFPGVRLTQPSRHVSLQQVPDLEAHDAIPRANDAMKAPVASWTGRSRVCAVTETMESRFETSGARCTRVSAVRIPAARVSPGIYKMPRLSRVYPHSAEGSVEERR
jgi:hypothetical protein